jgi:hypothetical protein
MPMNTTLVTMRSPSAGSRARGWRATPGRRCPPPRIAIEALLAGGAERAIHGAADLARNAQRAARDLRDEHRLDRLATVHGDHPLAGVVGGMVQRAHLRQADFRNLREPAPQRLRHVGHRLEVGDAEPVHPAHQLARAERLLAETDEKLLQSLAGQSQQVDARYRSWRSAGPRADFGAGEKERDLLAGRVRRRPSRARCSPRCCRRSPRGSCPCRPWPDPSHP